jgi:hypothetical protein
MGSSQSNLLDLGSLSQHPFGFFDTNACQDKTRTKKLRHRDVQRARTFEQPKFENLTSSPMSLGCDGTHEDMLSPFHGSAKSLPEIAQNNDSPWLKMPTPMPGWTLSQQVTVIEELRYNPTARKSKKSLRNVFESIHRAIPDKSLQEIEDCYQYLQRNRIAYFGSTKKLT